MSWDSYRDTLIKSGSVTKAAVVGHEGGVWSSSPGLEITADEIKTLIRGLSNAEALQASGVRVGGQKYMYILSDETQIQGKQGATGISIAKAGKCLIIGIYGDGQQPGNCRTQVESVRDYLVSVGY